MEAVGYNIVGPALPHALKALAAENLDSTLEPITGAVEHLQDRNRSVLTADNKIQLEQNSKDVARLEDIYSLTCVTCIC
jgi:hypothetical protein